jgi:hypothetical protein
MHGGMHRGMPKVNLKTHFKKNHALAESLLSRVFSWDVVDVGFPTCSISALKLLQLTIGKKITARKTHHSLNYLRDLRARVSRTI